MSEDKKIEKAMEEFNKKNPSRGLEYWENKTISERWAEVERLRRKFIKSYYGDNPPRFERIARIVKKSEL